MFTTMKAHNTTRCTTAHSDGKQSMTMQGYNAKRARSIQTRKLVCTALKQRQHYHHHHHHHHQPRQTHLYTHMNIEKSVASPSSSLSGSRRAVVVCAVEDEAQSSAIDLYEQMVASGSSASSTASSVDVQATDVVDAMTGLGSGVVDIDFSDPAILALAAVPVLGGLAFFAINSLGGNGGPKITSVGASRAYSEMTSPAVDDTQSLVCIDIRPKSEIKERGSPKINARGLRSANVSYLIADRDGDLSTNEDFCEDVVSVIEKAGRKSGQVTAFLIDGYGNQSKTAATAIGKYYQKLAKDNASQESVPSTSTVKIKVELPTLSLVTVNGGAESWKASELPWEEPRPDIVSALLGSVVKAQETFKEQPTLFGGLLAVGGVAAATSLFFAEVETAVEVIGGITLLNYAAKSFLFAENRKKTLGTVKLVLDEASGKTKSKTTSVTSEVAPKQKVSPKEISTPPPIANTQAEESKEKPVIAQTKTEDISKEDVKVNTAANGNSTTPVSSSSSSSSSIGSLDKRKKEAQQWIRNWKNKSKVNETISV